MLGIFHNNNIYFGVYKITPSLGNSSTVLTMFSFYNLA